MTSRDAGPRGLVGIGGLGRGSLESLFRSADRLRSASAGERIELCRGLTLATLFFEPSTRTRLSFEAAMLLVGGSCLSFGHPEMTKTSAGESLEDTVRVVDGYADVLAIRHPRDDAAEVAQALCESQVVNAGCGRDEHPTQALVDLYSMREAHGTIDGLTIGIMGDLRTQRAVKSLLLGLSLFDVRVHLIAHAERGIDPSLARLVGSRLDSSATDSLMAVIPTLDVLYAIRIPRSHTEGPADYERLRGDRRLRRADLAFAKNSLAVLNPLPRHDEVDTDVDGTPHAYYFRQAALGRYIRAALLLDLLDRELPVAS